MVLNDACQTKAHQSRQRCQLGSWGRFFGFGARLNLMTSSIRQELILLVPLRRDSSPISLSTSGSEIARSERSLDESLRMPGHSRKAKAPRVTRGLKWVLTAACIFNSSPVHEQTRNKDSRTYPNSLAPPLLCTHPAHTVILRRRRWAPKDLCTSPAAPIQPTTP